ncbi:sirohydrochlorin chelatase [Salipaludibacillus aurantiacus]|uniref:Sirohydrochlorin ferrochelatase n=1 Tax=Salipaludibacillus aurantiacus TaxID=1601833 RepID=A0A1H9WYF3_9BACI|nr:CbiX/SirB N-terminal domain-containing protein [Salipaludibacillus aurantiacus]SES38940.1 Sirohydrochlorin ferrochelatase [Salipaludibacillus aurantiacus]
MTDTLKKGILVIAHGSRNQKWVELIESSVTKLKTHAPVAIGYLELVEGKGIAEGVKSLEDDGVDEIYVIPYFVCSGSTHLEEIQYALGVLDNTELDTHLERIESNARILWGEPMDDNPHILDLLKDRISSLSNHPSQETLLLVAHGSNRPSFQPIWEKTLMSMCTQLQKYFGFPSASFATILPDTIEDSASKLTEKHAEQIIAVPVFLSEGYYTSKKIPEKFNGFPHVYSGETYLPHHLVNDWLQEQVNRYV